jgi:hypothetical protein
MKTIRILTASALAIATSLALSGCYTIGSLSYTTPEGRTLTVGFQQREVLRSDGGREGKAVVVPERRE